MKNKAMNQSNEGRKNEMLRKLYLSLFILFMACMGANAQMYIGGTVGFTSRKDVNEVSRKNFRFVPEIGWKLKGQLSVGINLGYRNMGITSDSGFSYECDKYISYGIAPYIRYNIYQNKKVRIFADGVASLWHVKYKGLQNAGEQTGKNIDGNRWTAGIRPGIAYDATQHFSFIAKIGWLGYSSTKMNGYKATGTWNTDLDTDNLAIGFLYHF